MRQTNRLSAQRVFLLGDAAGYAEPFTGEGIGWALSSAVAITPVVTGNLDRWNTESIENGKRCKSGKCCGGKRSVGRWRIHFAGRRRFVLQFVRCRTIPLLARPLVRQVYQVSRKSTCKQLDSLLRDNYGRSNSGNWNGRSRIRNRTSRRRPAGFAIVLRHSSAAAHA